MDIGTSHKLGGSPGPNGGSVLVFEGRHGRKERSAEAAGGGKRRGSAYDEADEYISPRELTPSITELILRMVSRVRQQKASAGVVASICFSSLYG